MFGWLLPHCRAEGTESLWQTGQGQKETLNPEDENSPFHYWWGEQVTKETKCLQADRIKVWVTKIASKGLRLHIKQLLESQCCHITTMARINDLDIVNNSQARHGAQPSPLHHRRGGRSKTEKKGIKLIVK